MNSLNQTQTAVFTILLHLSRPGDNVIRISSYVSGKLWKVLSSQSMLPMNWSFYYTTLPRLTETYVYGWTLVKTKIKRSVSPACINWWRTLHLKMFLFYLVYYDFTWCYNIPVCLRNAKSNMLLVMQDNIFIECMKANGLGELSQATTIQCETFMCDVFV